MFGTYSSTVFAAVLGLILVLPADGFTKVQAQKDVKVVEEKKTLPPVSQVMEKQTAVSKQMTSKVSSLEDRILEVQQHAEESINKMKTSFEAQLEDDRQQNKMLKDQNVHLAADVEKLHKDTKSLRSKADNLTKNNHLLNADLKTLQHNLTTVQEFTMHALNESAFMLIENPSLLVLDELAEQDALLTVGKKRALRLQEIGTAHKLRAKGSLLQTEVVGDAAQDILASLAEALEELGQEQTQSEAELTAAFEKDHKVNADQRDALLSKQMKLNQTKAAAVELKQRLNEAVVHLQSAHENLIQKTEAVRGYAKRMGQKENEEPIFLQMSSSRHQKTDKKDAKRAHKDFTGKVSKRHLPDVKKVLQKPAKAEKKVESKLTQLTQRLAAMNHNSEEAFTKERSNLEANLTSQKQTMDKVSSQNEKLAADLDKLHDKNNKLRDEATTLRLVNKELQSDLRSMQDNITSAQDLAEEALNKHVELSGNDALLVLRELEQKDAVEGARKKKSKALQAIRLPSTYSKATKTRKVSLIQTSEIADDAKDILSTLRTALDDFTDGTAESEETLMASFKKESGENAAKLSDLMEKQADLESKKASAEDTHVKLTAAIKHLKSAHEALLQKSKALRSFAQKLSARPLPKDAAILLQIEEEVNPIVAHHKSGGPQDKLGTNKAYQAVTSRVDNLELKVAKVEQQSLSDFQQTKHEYETVLNAKAQETSVIASKNHEIMGQIERVKASNNMLWTKATSQSALNKQLRMDLEKLQTNITTALEFSETELNASMTKLQSPELEVLDQLEMKQEENAEEQDKNKRLNYIANLQASLLDISPVVGKTDNSGVEDAQTQELLEDLATAFGSLQQEEEKSMKMLKVSFDKQYQAAKEHMKDTVAKQKELEGDLEAANGLSTRLQTALAFLETSHRTLKKRASALQVFMDRLAEKPLPTETELQARKIRAKQAAEKQAAEKKNAQAAPIMFTARPAKAKSNEDRATEEAEASLAAEAEIQKSQVKEHHQKQHKGKKQEEKQEAKHEEKQEEKPEEKKEEKHEEKQEEKQEEKPEEKEEHKKGFFSWMR